MVIEDGSGAALSGGAVEYEAALAGASPERDFGPRSNDDVYIIYTGGTTGYPKGVMWRNEDIWRTLGGGIDYVTGEPAGRTSGRRPARAWRTPAWSSW